MSRKNLRKFKILKFQYSQGSTVKPPSWAEEHVKCFSVRGLRFKGHFLEFPDLLLSLRER